MLNRDLTAKLGDVSAAGGNGSAGDPTIWVHASLAALLRLTNPGAASHLDASQ